VTATTNKNTEARSIKFGMKIDYKCTYELCMKYCLQLNCYKHGEGMHLWCYSWQI